MSTPDANLTAEVVLLVTSMSVSTLTFDDCNKATMMLETKKIPFTRIDCNADMGKDRRELALVAAWKDNGILRLKNKKVVILPQLLIDGCSIGGYSEMQDFEDARMLDAMAERRACPLCFDSREAGVESCGKCKTLFIKLMSEEAKHVKLERPVETDCGALELAHFAVYKEFQTK